MQGKTDFSFDALAKTSVLFGSGDGTDLVLRAGSDDQAKLYVNGQAVYRQPKVRDHELDEDEIPITLHKGVNILVFKVINEHLGGPMGSLHFVNKDGRPADGLRMGLKPE